jgi:hypothetical protein
MMSERAIGTTNNGYRWTPLGDTRVFFTRETAGASSGLKTFDAGTYQLNTWHRLKINRNTSGVFTFYIKGGSYGDNYTALTTVTDNTITTTGRFELNFGIGTRIANVKIYN